MRSVRKLVCALSAGGLAITFIAASPGTVAASGSDTHICSGTPTAPGVLAGTYESVRVVGACEVNAGPARVEDNLTVTPGAVLVAAFALNDTTHSGHSRLSVGGDLRVDAGATLLLGCDPQTFACVDDNPASPTLSSRADVDGNLHRQPAARCGGPQHRHRRQRRSRRRRWWLHMHTDRDLCSLQQSGIQRV